MIIYFVFLFMSVSLGHVTGADTGHCLAGYASCAQLLGMGYTDRCSTADNYFKCVGDVTGTCYPGLLNLVRGYQALLQEGCRPGSNLSYEIAAVAQCISTNVQHYEDCKLEGEFTTLADVCSSYTDLTECFQMSTERVCDKHKVEVMRKMFKPIKDTTDTCKNSPGSKDYHLSPCEKGLLECDRHIFGYKKYTCPEIEKDLRCYLDVFRKDCGEMLAAYIPILDKYVDQTPEYCNPDSKFRKDLSKSFGCIVENPDSIKPCHSIVQNRVSKAISDGVSEPKEMVLVQARASIEHYDCIADKLGSVCGKEASAVTKFVLGPLEEMLDNFCVQQSGEKCNGAVSLHLNVMLLVMSISYFLMKRE